MTSAYPGSLIVSAAHISTVPLLLLDYSAAITLDYSAAITRLPSAPCCQTGHPLLLLPLPLPLLLWLAA